MQNYVSALNDGLLHLCAGSVVLCAVLDDDDLTVLNDLLHSLSSLVSSLNALYRATAVACNAYVDDKDVGAGCTTSNLEACATCDSVSDVINISVWLLAYSIVDVVPFYVSTLVYA